MLDKRLFGRHPNTTHLLHNRSYYDVETLLRNRLQTAPALMDRLALSAELNGHTGCVNGLDWSANGRYTQHDNTWHRPYACQLSYVHHPSRTRRW